jgi:hypothetical protein
VNKSYAAIKRMIRVTFSHIRHLLFKKGVV